MKNIFTLIAFTFIALNGISQGTWLQKNSYAGSGRYRAIAFEINGKCYMGTGAILGPNNDLKDLWEYDVALDIWTQMADLTGPKRRNATATSANGFGYVGLGSDSLTLLNDWWQYDPAGNTWQVKTSFPAGSRFGAGSFSIQDTIYTGGGLDSANNPKTDFYAYDPINDLWHQKASMNIGVASMAVFTIGQKGYFVTGLINGSVSSVNTTMEYDANTDTWAIKTPYPAGNTFSAIGFAINGEGYVGTGFTGTLIDVMYHYNPVNNIWNQETNWPTGSRQWAVSCVSGNRAFVGTGNSTGGLLFNDWWEFIPLSTKINELKNNNTFNASFNSSSKEINIVTENGSGILKIFNLKGQLIFESKINSAKQNFSLNQQGIFIVTLMDGKKLLTTKVACIY